MKKIVSGMFSVKEIKEAPWNSNVMPAEEYARLNRDMKAGGPGAIDPILIADLPIGRIVVDGNHRLRKARELGWKEIRGVLDPNIDTEEKARAIGYVKNTERGHQDPYKLAEYFAWFSEVKKMTQEQIAKMHGIDRTTVTRVLSLLKIAPDVKAKLANVPYITISHLEPIAAAAHHIQREVIKHIGRHYETVADIARTVHNITEEFEKREVFRKAMATAKFPKCPKCGKIPNNFDYTYDGRKNEDKVRCENWHHWSLSKGIVQEKSSTGSETSESVIPQSIKSTHSLGEFRGIFKKIAEMIIPSFTKITRIEVNGDGGIERVDIGANDRAGKKVRKLMTEFLPDMGEIGNAEIEGTTKDGKDVEFRIEFWDWEVGLRFGSSGRTYGDMFDLKAHECKIKDHPEIKTRIGTASGARIEDKKDLAKLERQVQELFQKYGGRS